TTSQYWILPAKWVATPVMCALIAASRSVPEVMLLTHGASWLCQTRVWPRIFMLWLCAWLTRLSAAAKLNVPRDGSVVSHFISFSGVRPVNSVSKVLMYWASPTWPLATAAANTRPLAAAAEPSVAVAAFDGGAATMTAATPAIVSEPIAAARAARRVRWLSIAGSLR